MRGVRRPLWRRLTDCWPAAQAEMDAISAAWAETRKLAGDWERLEMEMEMEMHAAHAQKRAAEDRARQGAAESALEAASEVCHEWRGACLALRAPLPRSPQHRTLAGPRARGERVRLH